MRYVCPKCGTEVHAAKPPTCKGVPHDPHPAAKFKQQRKPKPVNLVTGKPE